MIIREVKEYVRHRNLFACGIRIICKEFLHEVMEE